jgi:hypothetical protein
MAVFCCSYEAVDIWLFMLVLKIRYETCHSSYHHLSTGLFKLLDLHLGESLNLLQILSHPTVEFLRHSIISKWFTTRQSSLFVAVEQYIDRDNTVRPQPSNIGCIDSLIN